MEAYTSFAQVYDLFMDEMPYEEWSTFLIQLLKENQVEDGLVLDLGCGTGKLTRLMRDAGYDMIGVDSSMEMLDMAREAGAEDILYLMQDMREFELYGTVRAVYSACDSLNYLLKEQDLEQVFRLANNYLDAEGLFIFDMKTPYTYQNLLADNTMADNREDASLIWENYYDEDTNINTYELTIFAKAPNSNLYERFEEMHCQRCYSLEQVKALLQQAGMQFVAAYDGYSRESLGGDSERMLIVAKEQRTEGKVYND